MKTYQIDVLEGANDAYVENILKDLERKHIVKFNIKTEKLSKENILQGKPFTEEEFDNLLEKASKSSSYTYEEAKVYLKL